MPHRLDTPLMLSLPYFILFDNQICINMKLNIEMSARLEYWKGEYGHVVELN